MNAIQVHAQALGGHPRCWSSRPLSRPDVFVIGCGLAAGVVLVPTSELTLKAPPIGRMIVKLLGLHGPAIQTMLIAVLRLAPVTYTTSQ